MTMGSRQTRAIGKLDATVFQGFLVNGHYENGPAKASTYSLQKKINFLIICRRCCHESKCGPLRNRNVAVKKTITQFTYTSTSIFPELMYNLRSNPCDHICNKSKMGIYAKD